MSVVTRAPRRLPSGQVRSGRASPRGQTEPISLTGWAVDLRNASPAGMGSHHWTWASNGLPGCMACHVMGRRRQRVQPIAAPLEQMQSRLRARDTGRNWTRDTGRTSRTLQAAHRFRAGGAMHLWTHRIPGHCGSSKQLGRCSRRPIADRTGGAWRVGALQMPPNPRRVRNSTRKPRLQPSITRPPSSHRATDTDGP